MSLLSGKYLQAEQVSPGLVQTFRARDFATGRPVFVHRIGDSDCGEQASLLKLLLSCLYRSDAVKQMVLEVREDAEACYVVTEAVPQCFLLREWLQFEAKTSEEVSPPPLDMPNVSRASKAEVQPVDVLYLSDERPAAPQSEERDGDGPAGPANDEISLPAPFVSDHLSPPRAAPIKIIRPLPPEFSSAALQKPRLALKPDSEEIDILSAPSRDGKPEAQIRDDWAADDAAHKPDELPPPAVAQKPMGVLPLDEFDRLFDDPVGVPERKAARTDIPAPVRQPFPPPAQVVTAPPPSLPHSRPVTGPVAPPSQWAAAPGSDAFAQPILPSAAQTVLESALAAQAASQRNRKLIIAAIAVVLIVLAIVLYLLIGPRGQ